MAPRPPFKVLAQSWLREPELLADDLSSVLETLQASIGSKAVWSPAELSNDDRQRIQLLSDALKSYCRNQTHSGLHAELLLPWIDIQPGFILAEAEKCQQRIRELRQVVDRLRKRTDRQAVQRSEGGQRSELLLATIEEYADGGELIVRTDRNGSVKIRGAMHIPMFLALWNAPQHRLSENAFLDLDRSMRSGHMERHRNRLSGRLRDVLLEIVVEKDGSIRLQKQRGQ